MLLQQDTRLQGRPLHWRLSAGGKKCLLFSGFLLAADLLSCKCTIAERARANIRFLGTQRKTLRLAPKKSLFQNPCCFDSTMLSASICLLKRISDYPWPRPKQERRRRKIKKSSLDAKSIASSLILLCGLAALQLNYLLVCPKYRKVLKLIAKESFH